MITLPRTPIRKRPSLTPMIDVVFLLLVFFMLAARFGTDVVIDLTTSGTTSPATDYQGPPRLVTLLGQGRVQLNGFDITLDDLGDALGPLMTSPSDAVIVQTADRATTQDVVDTITALQHYGIDSLVLVGR